ncbi:unnamed protein product, partial [marine sediment metagenome]
GIRPWTITYETILLFRRGKQQRMLNSPLHKTFDVIPCPRPQRNYLAEPRFDHPCHKPLALMNLIIARTPGQLVLDPFFGTGTTLVACAKNNRHYIGLEINPDFVYLAAERIKHAISNCELSQEFKECNQLPITPGTGP